MTVLRPMTLDDRDGVLASSRAAVLDLYQRLNLPAPVLGPLCRQGDTGPLAPYLPHTSLL
jgi:hypothetical protein